MLSPVVGNIRFFCKSTLQASALVLIPLTLLTACGGGGGGSGSAAATAAATTTAAASVTPGAVSVLYSGPVSGIGSIVLNGVRFETIGAKVHDADDPYGAASYPDQIKLGMTVSVEGSADESQGNGTAGTIRLDGGIRGQVSAIDTAANTLIVSGQSIKIDAKTTVFEGASGLSALSTSSWVEVYGLTQSDGTFLATRVEAYASSSALATRYPSASTYTASLRGVVVASAANSFTLSDGGNGTITVNYRAADVSPAGAAIQAGSSVRVLSGGSAGGAVVTASKVHVLSPASLLAQSSSSGVSVKLKGVVDSVSGNTIVVSGTTVDLSQAVISGGMPAAGQVVEVRGPLGNGTLMAAKLEFEDRETNYTAQPGGTSTAVSYRQELYGTISGYAPGSNSFTVQGVTVKVDGSTRYEHGYNTLADKLYVEVKGVLDNGALLASKIDVKGATAGSSSSSSSSAEAKSAESSAGSTGVVELSRSDDKHSSGGSSFELYGTLTCTTYPGSCSIAPSSGSALNANLSAANWSTEHGGYVAGTPLAVEAKGSLDSAGVYQVTKIERKS